MKNNNYIKQQIDHNLFLAKNTTGSHWVLLAFTIAVAGIVWLV